MMTKPHTQSRPERCRNVSAFSKAILARRSQYAIQSNQIRSAFARAVGLAA